MSSSDREREKEYAKALAENLLSPLTHDPQDDVGWVEVPANASKRNTTYYGNGGVTSLDTASTATTSGEYGDGTTPVQPATMETVKDALKALYWEGARRDVAVALLAYDDMDKSFPEAYEEEKDLNGLKTDYVREWLDIWDPLKLQSNAKDVVAETVDRVIDARLATTSIQSRRAQSLLQACGFMDTDFVQEHKKTSFRSNGLRAQVDSTNHPVILAIQCSECRNCVRSYHYFECQDGCKDSEMQRNFYKTQPHVKSSQVDHQKQLANQPSPYRICPNCLLTTEHPREHLKAVRKFTKLADREAHLFSKDLDTLEDHLASQSLLAYGSYFIDKYTDSGGLYGKMKSLSRKNGYPAGNTHCAFMFGPLLVENGVTLHPGGAMISLRDPPSISRYSSKELKEFLADPKDIYQINGHERVMSKFYAVSPDRRLFCTRKASRERRFMSARKQICGGLFSGHCTEWEYGEMQVVDQFLRQAAIWRSKKVTDGPEDYNRRLLKDCADEIVKELKTHFAREISLYIITLALRLSNYVKLQFHRSTNNCQDFCNALLFDTGGEFDKLFSNLYPQYPQSMEQKRPEWLRYMISFAQPVKLPMDMHTTRNKLASPLSLYSAFPYNDADIIDHVSSIRFKLDAATVFPENNNKNSIDGGEGNKNEKSKWRSYTGDEYLLKDGEMTCSRSSVCSLGDHLLDSPFDNASILQMHLLRPMKAYTDPTTDRLLPYNDARVWYRNRIAVLHRLYMLNMYVGTISMLLQRVCLNDSATWSDEAKKAAIYRTWKPPSTHFGRCWHHDKRDENKLVSLPDRMDNDEEDETTRILREYVLTVNSVNGIMQLLQPGTGPNSANHSPSNSISSNGNYNNASIAQLSTSPPDTNGSGNNAMKFHQRFKSIKSAVMTSGIVKRSPGWIPWMSSSAAEPNCTCTDCQLEFMVWKLRKWERNRISVESGGRMPLMKGHPDYIEEKDVEEIATNLGVRSFLERTGRNVDVLLRGSNGYNNNNNHTNGHYHHHNSAFGGKFGGRRGRSRRSNTASSEKSKTESINTTTTNNNASRSNVAVHGVGKLEKLDTLDIKTDFDGKDSIPDTDSFGPVEDKVLLTV